MVSDPNLLRFNRKIAGNFLHCGWLLDQRHGTRLNNSKEILKFNYSEPPEWVSVALFFI